MLTWEEVAKHASTDSCWVVIRDKAYDVTHFLNHHPGGVNSLLRYAGKDGTEEYELIHSLGTIEKTLEPEYHLGPVDPTGKPAAEPRNPPKETDPNAEIPLSFMFNLNDIENVAQKKLSKRAWSYYHSAADSLESMRVNLDDFKKISFRPRVLKDVTKVNMDRTIMGHKSSLPFFIAPAAMAKLGHKDGELCNARGAGVRNIPYCTSTYSSIPHEDLAAELAQHKGGCLLFQLYVSPHKDMTLKRIKMARDLGFKALVVTVDTPVLGKREEDERYMAEVEFEAGVVDIPRTGEWLGATRDAAEPILRGGIDSSSLNWEDLTWIREAWGNTGPLVLKGIQTAEDAKKAVELGLDGIYLSNHGGRQLDCAPSSIRTLLEIRRFCPEILGKIDIYMDGGFRRGADILKALCLGATAVSCGRPFMYALGAYGNEGVLKVIQLLSDEVETTMRLLGVTDLSQLNADLVNTTVLERELPGDLRAFKPRSRL